jgi:hypothetical protein
MTVLLDALLGLGVFNVVFLLMVVATRAFNERPNRGRVCGATRRLAGSGVRAPRVRPWEPFVETLEERRVALSSRDTSPRD